MFLKSGRVSYGGMITAAMVVLLYLSCVFENCSLFCLAAAAFLGGVTTWQRGWKDGLLVSAAAGVLGVVLLPNKWYVLTYAAFVLYVFAWECLEHFFSKKQRMLAWILKGILYHVLLISAVCSYVYVFGFQQLVQGFLLTVWQRYFWQRWFGSYLTGHMQYFVSNGVSGCIEQRLAGQADYRRTGKFMI